MDREPDEKSFSSKQARKIYDKVGPLSPKRDEIRKFPQFQVLEPTFHFNAIPVSQVHQVVPYFSLYWDWISITINISHIYTARKNI